MFGWLFKEKTLSDKLSETKKVKIEGIIFRMRKINPLDYLSGAQVMQEVYSLYRKDPSKATDQNVDKVKKHMIDVIMAGVVMPSLSRKDEGGSVICVDRIIENMDMATELYNAVWAHAYGCKKKLKTLNSLSQN